MDRHQVIAAALLVVTLFVLVLDGTRASSDPEAEPATESVRDVAPEPTATPHPASDQRLREREVQAPRAFA